MQITKRIAPKEKAARAALKKSLPGRGYAVLIKEWLFTEKKVKISLSQIHNFYNNKSVSLDDQKNIILGSKGVIKQLERESQELLKLMEA